MVVDLESVAIAKDGVPIAHGVHWQIFGDRFNNNESSRPLYEWLIENKKPVYVVESTGYKGSYDYIVWEMSRADAVKFLKWLYKEYYKLAVSKYDIEFHIEDHFGIFEQARIFVICG